MLLLVEQCFLLGKILEECQSTGQANNIAQTKREEGGGHTASKDKDEKEKENKKENPKRGGGGGGTVEVMNKESVDKKYQEPKNKWLKLYER